jgi:hypothetical protein
MKSTSRMRYHSSMTKSKDLVAVKSIELPAEAYFENIPNDGAYHFPVKYSYIQKKINVINKKIALFSVPLGGIGYVGGLFVSLSVENLILGIPMTALGVASVVFGVIPSKRIFKKKPQLELEKSYEILNTSLIEWMKKEYNLTVSLETANGLNRFYFENMKTEGYDYPWFHDDKDDRYKLILDPFKDNGAKIVVAADYEEKLAKLEQVNKSNLIKEITSTTSSVVLSVKYDFTESQQELYNTVKSNISTLTAFALNVEDKYELDRIKRELAKVLELHSSAISLKAPHYDSGKLDSLLSRFVDELENLRDKQLSSIHRELETHQQISLER